MKNYQKGFAITIIIAIVAVLAIGGGVFVYTKEKAEAPIIQSVQSLKNSTIVINIDNYDSVKFVDGQYSFKFFQGKGEGEPNTDGYLNINRVIFGDLGVKYENSTVVIFKERLGGTGVFYKLGVVFSVDQENKLIDWVNLGDRIDVKSLSINNGNIEIERSVEDSCGASCESGQYKTEVYKIVNDRLQKVITDNPSTKRELPVACTMDAMMCPDGSYVGRSGPNCQFVCPVVTESVLCDGLNEKSCSDNPKCRTIFGPSFCSDSICTTDLVFKSCVNK